MTTHLAPSHAHLSDLLTQVQEHLTNHTCDPTSLYFLQHALLTFLQGDITPSHGLNPTLLLPCDSLPFGTRVGNILRNNNCLFMWQLVQCRRSELLTWKYFGPGCADMVEEVVENLGLHLGMQFSAKQLLSLHEACGISFKN